MDNISHSVAGLIAGELIHRSLRNEPSEADCAKRRACIVATSVIANNFPDLDLLYARSLTKPLGYLLHHRGHTHTLVGAIPQTFLILLLLFWVWPTFRQQLKANPQARRGIGLGAVVGLLLHFVFDSLNSYGVHLFYPFNNGWFYGDLVFIVEPFFWICLGIPFACTIKRQWLKRVFLAALFIPLFVFTLKGWLTVYSFAALVAVAIILRALAVDKGRRGLAAGLVFFGCLIALHVPLSLKARRDVMTALAPDKPAVTVVDIALTPLPANPACWNFVAMVASVGGAYRAVEGRLSVLPWLIKSARCPWLDPSSRVQVNSETLDILAVREGNLRDLQILRRKNCWFDAWLRFARIPVVTADVAEDARFDHGAGRNFSQLALTDFDEGHCPTYVPPWIYPRRDRLGPDER